MLQGCTRSKPSIQDCNTEVQVVTISRSWTKYLHSLGNPTPRHHSSDEAGCSMGSFLHCSILLSKVLQLSAAQHKKKKKKRYMQEKKGPKTRPEHTPETKTVGLTFHNLTSERVQGQTPTTGDTEGQVLKDCKTRVSLISSQDFVPY